MDELKKIIFNKKNIIIILSLIILISIVFTGGNKIQKLEKNTQELDNEITILNNKVSQEKSELNKITQKTNENKKLYLRFSEQYNYLKYEIQEDYSGDESWDWYINLEEYPDYLEEDPNGDTQ
ncbi:MAG: hypothetical protein ACOCP8_02420 [archaeon]